MLPSDGSIGWMRVAQRAGKTSRAGPWPKRHRLRRRGATGHGSTWNGIVDMKRVSASEATIPIAMPAALSAVPSKRTSFQTLDRYAPKATRIAISLARTLRLVPELAQIGEDLWAGGHVAELGRREAGVRLEHGAEVALVGE